MDSFLLILAGIVAAMSVWALWYFSGSDGNSAVLTLALIGTVADNLRLRRKLRSKDS